MVTSGRLSRRGPWLEVGWVRSDKKRRMASRRREEDRNASEAKKCAKKRREDGGGSRKGACDLDSLYEGSCGRRAAPWQMTYFRVGRKHGFNLPIPAIPLAALTPVIRSTRYDSRRDRRQ
jgi:hypothetical protein